MASVLVLLVGIALFLGLPFVLSVGSVVFLPPVTAMIFTIILSPLADRLIRLGLPNVLASFLFRDVPDHPHVLTQVVALAAVQTAAELFGCDVQLKWPNDLMLNDTKVAGVLAQSGSIDAASGRPSFVVVGIGINIGWAPEGAAALSAGSSVEQLRDTGKSPSHMVRNMCPNIDDLLELDRKTLHERYRAHLATIGREVHVSLPGGESLAGRAIDVEADGRLVVVDECAITHRFDTADVIHLR